MGSINSNCSMQNARGELTAHDLLTESKMRKVINFSFPRLVIIKTVPHRQEVDGDTDSVEMLVFWLASHV